MLYYDEEKSHCLTMKKNCDTNLETRDFVCLVAIGPIMLKCAKVCINKMFMHGEHNDALYINLSHRPLILLELWSLSWK